MTGDSQLKPYTSWADLATNLKHEASLVNFIAAYGTHASITGATDDRRQARGRLRPGLRRERHGRRARRRRRPTVAVPADRLAFLNSTGAWANTANGVTITGVDAIDLWIGGLAEKQMPFGGLLGSTFNFVFENADGEAAGRRPLLLPGAHARA